MQLQSTLDSGRVFSQLQAEGEGDNHLSQTVSGSSYALTTDVDSQGVLSLDASSFASGESGSLIQGVAGAGSLSFSSHSVQEGEQASQEAIVACGSLASSQSLSAGAAAFAGQSTEIEGEGGRVGSQSFGSQGLMLAEGSIRGTSSLDADLSAGGGSQVGGEIAVNGANWLDSATLQTIGEENLGMSLLGLQATPEGGIGSFSVQAVRMDGAALAQAAAQSSGAGRGGEATALSSLAGGSSSSYILARNSAGYPYKWTQAQPKVQLYLKANTVPSNLNQEDVRSAISAAANTWDDAVAKNLFADGTTVISDSGKSIDTRDGYNVNAWKYLAEAPSALAYARTWSGGPIVDGFYSAIESDVSYNTNWAWSTSGGNYDVQSVATHELGHTIGLGDIYSSTYGGTLPPSDPRTQDYEQVMNLYNGPQRQLGNGDLAGAQALYGVPVSGPQYCMSEPFTTI